MSCLEDALAFQIRSVKLPDPVREYRFCREIVGNEPGVRKRLGLFGLQDWRFDFAWPDLRVAVEVDGGLYNRGGHTRGQQIESDMLKQDAAIRYGWTYYRCGARMVASGHALKTIELILAKAMQCSA